MCGDVLPRRIVERVTAGWNGGLRIPRGACRPRVAIIPALPVFQQSVVFGISCALIQAPGLSDEERFQMPRQQTRGVICSVPMLP